MKDHMILVLCVGQSNMAGRGIALAEDLKPVPGLLAFGHDCKWHPAIEPVNKDRPFVGAFAEDGTKITSADPWDAIPDEMLEACRGHVVGVGPGRTFGRLLAEANPSRTVGLVPAAVGGTPVSAWKRGCVDPADPALHPYDDAIALARSAMSYGTFGAILWHQGETDALRRNTDYKADIMEVIQNFRTDLNMPSVPFLMGELAGFYEENVQRYVPMINAAMYAAAEELPYCAVASAKELSHRGDNLHFSADAAHRLGERYFAAYQALVK